MKKIFKLLFTIILLLPIMVQAEVIDLELEKQQNYGVETDGSQGEITIFRHDDFYLGFYDNSGGAGVNVDNYYAIDKEGNKMYSSDHDSVTLYTGEKLYIIDREATRDSNKIYTNTFNISEINLLTGEETKTYSFADQYTTGYSYINNLYFNENGIILDTSDSNIYCITSDLESHSIVDDTYLYDNYELASNNDRLNEEEYNKFINYLYNKLSIDEYNLLIDYAVEYENNYFTVIINEGGVVSLVYTTKYLVHDVHNKNLQNEEIADLEINQVEIFAEEKNLNVFLHAGYAPCPRANNINIPTACYSNGDVILQQYTPIYNIEKKTDGNGTIEAIEQSKSGKTITYKVIPNKGYKVEKITITDANGNKIEIKDDEFTMPSADVIIEATFVVDNPNTSEGIYLGLGIILLIAGVFIIIRNKAKLDFINE